MRLYAIEFWRSIWRHTTVLTKQLKQSLCGEILMMQTNFWLCLPLHMRRKIPCYLNKVDYSAKCCVIHAPFPKFRPSLCRWCLIFWWAKKEKKFKVQKQIHVYKLNWKCDNNAIGYALMIILKSTHPHTKIELDQIKQCDLKLLCFRVWDCTGRVYCPSLSVMNVRSFLTSILIIWAARRRYTVPSPPLPAKSNKSS